MFTFEEEILKLSTGGCLVENDDESDILDKKNFF